jgi:hypothetical protein
VRRPTKKALAVSATALAAVAAAVAIPAWAASGGEHRSSAARHNAGPPPGFGRAHSGDGGFPPAPPLTGKARKRLDETAHCLRSHAADIPGVHASAHGLRIGPNADPEALRKAAKACGAPPLPPQGALPPGLDPAHRARLDRRLRSCLPPRGRATERRG